MGSSPPQVLLVSGYFKGERFIKRMHEQGARAYLLTQQKLLSKPWPREALTDVFATTDDPTLQNVIHTVSYLARDRAFDAIVALDDFDVETAAALREHLRLPGLGDTVARRFRDKLAMRSSAAEAGIAVPPFVHVLNHERLDAFMKRVPPPWMFKPRSEASATGIVRVESADELWRTAEEKGDRRSYHLLEKYLPGDVFHVDSLSMGGRVVFSAVHRCGKPPFDVAHGGGIFTTSTVERGSTVERELIELNTRVLTALGLPHGASHTEYIRHSADGKLYLLETSARVGGAHIAEVVEASSGINLWAEWASIELATLTGQPYTLPAPRAEYAGVLMTLAKQARPDLSRYDDPEVVYRAPEEHHAGLVVRSPDHARLESLMSRYAERFMGDFFASMPASDKPSF